MAAEVEMAAVAVIEGVKLLAVPWRRFSGIMGRLVCGGAVEPIGPWLM
jgi:hypothetical protein